MGVLNMLKLILRLTVITATIKCQLIITQSSRSCAISKNNTQSGEIEFVGNAREFCYLHTITHSSAIIVVEVPSTTLPFDLYVEREDTGHCSDGSYAMINGQAESCYAVFATFTQNRLQLNLQGNISVNLKEIHSMDHSIPVYPGCTETGHDFTETINVISNVKCKLEWYKQVISCDEDFKEFCRLSFPNNCDASLGYREVELKCDENEEENQKVFLVYPDIKILDLSRNNIVNIDSRTFHELSSLKGVSLDRNQLQELPIGVFDNLGELITLSLSFNQLKSIDKGMLVNLKQLIDLYFYENRIKTIESRSFQNLAKLTFLTFTYNMLTSLHADMFIGLHSLKTLYLYENRLQQLPIGVFNNLGDLILLSLSFNQLKSIDNVTLINLQSLDELQLKRNQIKTIESGCFHNLSNLTLLNLAYNMLTSLPTDTFKGLHTLQVLDLDGNQLQQLSIGVLDNSGDLTELYISYNQIKSIDRDMFVNLKKLIILELDRNQIKTIESGCFHNLVNLAYLDFSYNRLTSLRTDTFQGLYSLKELDMYANKKMTTLPRGLFHNLTKLTFLQFGNNAIMTIETESFKDLGELVFLFLEHNDLTHLYSGIFTGLDNLEILTVGRNQLRWIDPDVFHPLPKLKSLGLDVNMLIESNNEWFWELIDLEALFLGSNRFRTIGRELFIGLTKLKWLGLGHNQFDELDFDIFYETQSLEYLTIAFNRLQSIPNIKHLVQLKYLNIRGNPLLQMKKILTLPNNAELEVSQHEICECFVSSNIKNITCSASDPRSPYLTCNRLLADRALVAMMWLIGLNAIGGNVFVLVWKLKHGQKNKVQDLLLSNLAISDSIMGIYMVMIAIADVYFGIEFPMYSESWRSGITCRIAGGLSILSSEASVFFVTLISIDRFICVRFPFTTRKLSKRSAYLATTLIWLFSLALGVIPSSLAGRNENFYDNSHVCIGLPLSLIGRYSVKKVIKRTLKDHSFIGINTFNTTYYGEFHGKHFSNSIFLGLNGICYLVILICYIEIVRATFKSSKRSGLNKELKDELRMTLKVTTIVATDFCCWFPIIILGILVQTRVITLPASVYAWCVTFVIPINSAINPYLYTISNVISDCRKQPKA